MRIDRIADGSNLDETSCKNNIVLYTCSLRSSLPVGLGRRDQSIDRSRRLRSPLARHGADPWIVERSDTCVHGSATCRRGGLASREATVPAGDENGRAEAKTAPARGWVRCCWNPKTKTPFRPIFAILRWATWA